VAEIVGNIVEHARAGVEQMRLQMSMLADSSHVTVSFLDDGSHTAIDVDSAQMPGESAEDGRGLAMAKTVLNALTYRREGGFNRWTLVSRSF